MLVRRRLFQISLSDILLAMTAAVALLVSYDSLAPRTLVYTLGFLGGMLGSAAGMNRDVPWLWQVLGAGVLLGIAGGWVAAMMIEALAIGVPYESPWKTVFRRGRVPATEFATLYGAIGGAIASSLTTSLNVFKGWMLRQRATRDAVVED